MSSGQAPFFAATPGAHDGQAAPACSPGTVRVTPATLTETSMADGSNAPSLGPSGVMSDVWSIALARYLRASLEAYRAFALLEAAFNSAGSPCAPAFCETTMTDDVTKDSNGNILADGDSVTLIKDLKVKGSGGVTLKRGTLVKNIRLTGDTDEIEANVEKVRGLVLRTEFVKKA